MQDQSQFQSDVMRQYASTKVPFGGRLCLLAWLAIGFCGGVAAPLDAQATESGRSPHVPEGYRLVWHDEFDGTTLDLEKWRYRQLGKRESGVVTKNAVSLEGDGILRLTTFKRDGVLHVGMIGTRGRFQQRYGYFEARIKFQSLQGHHGAFWLQSPTYGKFVDDPGRSGAEIDIFEFFGSGRRDRGGAVNVYWNRYTPQPLQAGPKKLNLDPVLGIRGRGAKPKELSDDFHVYALLWTDKEYVFFVDGHELYRTSEGLSHRDQYAVLSLLCSGWERERLNDAALPDSMAVDYVRVYAPGKE